MSLLSAIVPGGTGLLGPPGVFGKIWNHVEGIGDAFTDIITEDIPGIIGGIEDVHAGWELIKHANYLMEEVLPERVARATRIPIVGLAVAFIVAVATIAEATAFFVAGVAMIAWGIAQVLWYSGQLIFDLARIVYHAAAIGVTVAIAGAKLLIKTVISLIQAGPGSAVMSLVDPMKMGRAVTESVIGVEKVLVPNDYVRAPGFLGKGIVRHVITVPLVGQLAQVKLNRNHTMVIVPSSECSLLGHIYNSVRF